MANYKIATLNCNGLSEKTNHFEIKDIVKTYKIDILFLQETSNRIFLAKSSNIKTYNKGDRLHL